MTKFPAARRWLTGFIFLFAIASGLLAFGQAASAQMLGVPAASAAPSAPAPMPVDSFGRETPRGLIKALLASMAGSSKAAPLDLMELPQSSRSFQEARAKGYFEDLRLALNRSGKLIDSWEASSEPMGHLGDGLPENQERIGVISSNGSKIDIIARRMPLGEGRDVAIWLITHDSLAAISVAAEDLEISLIDRLAPSFLADVSLGGVPSSHIGFALLAALALLVTLKLIVRIVTAAGMKLLGIDGGNRFGAIVIALRPMLVTLLLGLAIGPCLAFAGASVVLRGILAPLVHTATVVALMLILLRLADRLSHAAIDRARRRGFKGSISFLALGRRAAKFVIVFMAILAALNSIGVDLTAGLAALGIGGIAVALGSQKTIGDFVGSLSVVADRVVKIGDVCRFGTVIGTVEDIGIRSTRIRTLERTILNIPNGVFSATEIENFSERDMFRFHHLLALSTPPSAMVLNACLADLRSFVLEHGDCDAEMSRVRLSAMTAGLPQVEFMAYFRAPDMAGFAEIQEGVLLGLMEIVERHGLQMGLPTQVFRMAEPPKAG